MSVEEAILASPSPSCIFLKWQRRAERAKTFETPTQGGSEYLLINNTHSTAARGLLPFWNPQLVEMAHMFAMKGNITSQVVTLQPYVGTGRVSRSFSSDYWVQADVCRSSGVIVLSIEEVTMDRVEMEIWGKKIHGLKRSICRILQDSRADKGCNSLEMLPWRIVMNYNRYSARWYQNWRWRRGFYEILCHVNVHLCLLPLLMEECLIFPLATASSSQI